MTVIVGHTDGEIVTLAGDAIGVSGYSKSVAARPKVFKKTVQTTGQSIVFGYCGSFRFGQLLEFKFVVPPLGEDDDPYEWAVCELVPSIQRLCEDGGLKPSKDNNIFEVNILVGVGGRLFSVESDLQVGEWEDSFYAIGMGEDYARGSMFSTESSDLSVEDRLTMAVEAAARFCTGVCLPVSIVSTQDDVSFEPECPVVVLAESREHDSHTV